MKKRTKGIVAVVSGIILATTLVACGFHHKTPEEKADYVVEKITKKLELTPAQVTQLEQLKSQLLTTRQTFADKKEKARNTIDSLLSQPTLDQQRTMALVKEHTDEVNQTAPTIIASLAGFYDSLTPEQQTQLREKLEEYRDHFHRPHH
ncbi:Spy/CpxP family protein refolding chaperone [Pseudomonadota bacterium]